MATNPMQRKARNSFLLGMLLTLVITGIIIALLFLQLKNYREKEATEKANSVKVWVLGQDVISGQVITTDMLTQQVLNKTLVPNNAIGDMSILNNYALSDKEGNEVITEYKNNTATLYLSKNGSKYEIKTEDTGSYYIERNNEKEYVELSEDPIIAKVDMNKYTLITTVLISKSDNIVQDDVRRQEYNMIVLPADLATGDYIDIRLMLPSGQDYIVVSKKEVEIPNIGGVDSSDTIWVNLSEDETLHLSCAIVDAFKINGAKLYATKYTEAGMQEAAKVTYVMTQEATKLLENDPNILERAMNEIRSRYNSTATLRNDYINKEIENQGDQAQTNYQTNMSDSVTNSKNTRKEYLDSLSGVVE